MMVEEKKHQQLYVERLSMLKKIMKIKLRFGEMENRQEVFYILMIVLTEH